jgi:hypothetical protein
MVNRMSNDDIVIRAKVNSKINEFSNTTKIICRTCGTVVKIDCIVEARYCKHDGKCDDILAIIQGFCRNPDCKNNIEGTIEIASVIMKLEGDIKKQGRARHENN